MNNLLLKSNLMKNENLPVIIKNAQHIMSNSYIQYMFTNNLN